MYSSVDNVVADTDTVGAPADIPRTMNNFGNPKATMLILFSKK
jgi:hypothetical protein